MARAKTMVLELIVVVVLTAASAVLFLCASAEPLDLELGVTDIPEHCVMYYFYPNETKAIGLYVENQGSLGDTYILELSVENPSWSGWLDRYHFDDVSPGERRTFNLTMSAPEDDLDADRTNVTLVAASTQSDMTRRMDWFLFLIVERGVTISCDAPALDVESGGLARFDLVLTNTGEVRDDYSIEDILMANDQGWSATITPRYVSLGPHRTAHVTVLVSVPTLGTDPCMVIVKAQSNSSVEVWSSVSLGCWPRYVFHASLRPASDNATVVPGVKNSVMLTLVQATNSPKPYIWQMDTWCSEPDWVVQWPWLQRPLTAASTLDIPLYVTPPGQVRPSETALLTMTLTRQAFPTPVLSATFLLTVTERHEVDIRTPRDAHPALPGHSAGATVTVYNIGNVQELCEVRVQPPEGWTVAFPKPASLEGLCLLVPGARSELEVELHVPPFTAPMIYLVPVSLFAGGREMDSCQVRIDVGEFREVQLEATGSGGLEVEAGEWTFTRIALRNLGNVPEELTLWVAVDNERCDVGLDVNAIGLSPGAGKDVRLNLAASDKSRFGPSRALVTATAARESLGWVLELHFNVTGPDLTIASFQLLSEIVADEPLSIEVKVDNVGHALAPRSLLVVRDMFNGTLAVLAAVPPIPAGGCVTVNLTIIPPRGWSHYTLVVNEDGAVREDGMAPNSNEVRVFAPGEQGAGVDRASHGDILYISALVGLVLFLFLARRRLVGR